MAINSKSQSLEKAFGVICFAYVLALIVAMAVGYAVRALHPLLVVFISDIAATLVIYIFGRVFRNASFYDPYWSVAPLAVALYWVIRASAGSPVTARQIIVAVLVYTWGMRLTYNLGARLVRTEARRLALSGLPEEIQTMVLAH